MALPPPILLRATRSPRPARWTPRDLSDPTTMGYALQRVDSPPRFLSDLEAHEHVLLKAGSGSGLHARALEFWREVNPERFAEAMREVWRGINPDTTDREDRALLDALDRFAPPAVTATVTKPSLSEQRAALVEKLGDPGDSWAPDADALGITPDADDDPRLIETVRQLEETMTALDALLALFTEIDGGEHDDDPVVVAARRALGRES